MTGQPLNVLFLCTGNSCRSIIGEALLNVLGAGRFCAYSAGSNPVGAVNRHALVALERHGYPTGGLHSKDVDEFLGPHAPHLDIVFTVCDNAAEACPIWPGETLVVHWGLPDPAHVEGDAAQVETAFDATLTVLRTRIEGMLALDLAAMDVDEKRAALAALGGQPLEEAG